MSQDQPFIRKSHGYQLGWNGVLGVLQGGANSASQVDGVSDVAPACWICGSVRAGRAQKMDNGLCQSFYLGESCSPVPALMPDTLVPSCMPLVLFKLLPWCWSSEGMSLSMSLCGFFKGNCLGLQKFLLPTQSPLFFCSSKLWGLIFLALQLWAGGSGVGLGLFTPEISLQNFYPPHMDVGPAQAHSMSSPFLPV